MEILGDMLKLDTVGGIMTNLDKSFTKISGLASSICLWVCVVSKPTVLHPAARPLRTPEGASSNTMALNRTTKQSTDVHNRSPRWHSHLAGSTPHFPAARRYGSGLNDVLNERHKSRSSHVLRFTPFDVLGNNKNIGLRQASGFQGSLRVFTGSRGADSPNGRRRGGSMQKLQSVGICIGISITRHTYLVDDLFHPWEHLNSSTTVLLGWGDNSLFEASRLFLEL